MPFFLGLFMVHKIQLLGKSIGGQAVSWTPALTPIRRALGPMTRNLGIDISPFILIFLLIILNRMLLP